MVDHLDYLYLDRLRFLAALDGVQIGDLDVLDCDDGQRKRLELEHDGLADAKDLKAKVEDRQMKLNL